MPTKDQHQDALVSVIAEAMNVYLRAHNGVHVDVVQSALGSILTETFEKFTTQEQRMHALDNFCAILRETVEDMEHERAAMAAADAADDDADADDAYVLPTRTLQ